MPINTSGDHRAGSVQAQDAASVLHKLVYSIPPPDLDDPSVSGTGITVWQFPEWFIVRKKMFRDERECRSRMLVSRNSMTKMKYVDVDRKAWPVVPVRFVPAPVAAAISVTSTGGFLTLGSTTCTKQLYFDEEGTSGDLRDEVGNDESTLLLFKPA